MIVDKLLITWRIQVPNFQVDVEPSYHGGSTRFQVGVEPSYHGGSTKKGEPFRIPPDVSIKALSYESQASITYNP